MNRLRAKLDEVGLKNRLEMMKINGFAILADEKILLTTKAKHFFGSPGLLDFPAIHPEKPNKPQGFHERKQSHEKHSTHFLRRLSKIFYSYNPLKLNY